MKTINLNIGNMGNVQSKLLGLEPKINAAKQALEIKRCSVEWMDLPYTQEYVMQDILKYVERVKPWVETVVVLGIGGSALGPKALQGAIHSQFYNDSKILRKGNPKFYVLENIEPNTIIDLLTEINPETTLFSIVSKSGTTTETMAQFLIIKYLLEAQLGKSAKHRIVCTTSENKGSLVKVAREQGYKLFYIPEGVGGRFSQLSPVGLLPAALCGIDIRTLLQGAEDMDKLCTKLNWENNPAYMIAILHYISMLEGKNITVMMSYSDKLKYFTEWFAQLWAESLGKEGKGQTPVRALGTTDQHSQLQLYTEGPDDKLIVFLKEMENEVDLSIPKPEMRLVTGESLGEILNASYEATKYSLSKAGRNSMTIEIPKINEHSMGQLFYMMEVATAFAAELMKINAFDQPGVEIGKIKLQELLKNKEI